MIKNPFIQLLVSILTPFSYSLNKDGKTTYLTNKIRLLSLFNSSYKKKYRSEILHLSGLNEDASHYDYILPYPFAKDSSHHDIDAFYDQDNKLFYVLHKGKKLYFKESINTLEKVKYSYHTLLLEQNEKSPHKYTNDVFFVKDGSILADVGAAEGIFSLENIDKVKKIYLFEANTEWLKAQKLTFEPWKDKISIINKFVSDTDDEKNIRLDTFFEDKQVDFFKIDVDGAEQQLLKGASQLIDKKKSNFAITTYHNQSDASEFEAFFHKKGYTTSFSKGYLLLIYWKLRPPYFRKAILQAKA